MSNKRPIQPGSLTDLDMAIFDYARKVGLPVAAVPLIIRAIPSVDAFNTLRSGIRNVLEPADAKRISPISLNRIVIATAVAVFAAAQRAGGATQEPPNGPADPGAAGADVERPDGRGAGAADGREGQSQE